MTKKAMFLILCCIFTTTGIFAQTRQANLVTQSIQHSKEMERYRKQVEKNPSSGSNSYFNTLMEIQLALVEEYGAIRGNMESGKRQLVEYELGRMQENTQIIYSLRRYFGR